METITLNLIEDDFSGDYSNPFDCALGKATRRILGWKNPNIVYGSAYNGDKECVYVPKNTILNGQPVHFIDDVDLFSSRVFNFIKDKIKNGEFETCTVDLLPENEYSWEQ